MKKAIAMFSVLFLLSACTPAAVRPAGLAPTFTPWVPEAATITPILDWATPAPTTQTEKVVTLLPEQTTPTPGDTAPTTGERDLTPIVLEGLEVLTITSLTYIDDHAGFALD